MKQILRAAARNSAWNLLLFFGPLAIYWATRATLFYGAFHGWWPLVMR